MVINLKIGNTTVSKNIKLSDSSKHFHAKIFPQFLISSITRKIISIIKYFSLLFIKSRYLILIKILQVKSFYLHTMGMEI